MSLRFSFLLVNRPQQTLTFVSRILEWRNPTQELVAQYAERPIIDTLVVLPTLNHFWRKVVEGTAERLSSVARGVYAPTKVADFEVAVETEKKVLWFDVAVNNVLAMEIGQCFCHLGNVLQEMAETE